jgi:hypothetical protein
MTESVFVPPTSIPMTQEEDFEAIAERSLDIWVAGEGIDSHRGIHRKKEEGGFEVIVCWKRIIPVGNVDFQFSQ